jgi:hypothetical protein
MRKRRYEILLPVRHNDGRLVSWELLEQTREELVARFGGITVAAQPYLGIWVQRGRRFDEEMRRFTVDIDNTAPNRQFFTRYKGKLRERFEQIEIYIASYLVDIVKSDPRIAQPLPLSEVPCGPKR